MGYWEEFNANERQRDHSTAIGVGTGLSIAALANLIISLILDRGVDTLIPAAVFLLMGVPPLLIGLRRRAQDRLPPHDQ